MARYRDALPQLEGGFFLTDGGIETTLIFLQKQELPHFAAFHLLKSTQGEEALREYFRTYCEIARRFKTGLVLESATWRASADWGARLGYAISDLAHANRRAIGLLEDLRDEYDPDPAHIVISGCVGPRGDGYVPGSLMSEKDAEVYHEEQIGTFAETSVDMVCAVTMNYSEEAIGIARAAQRAGLPVAISFTVETNGKLPTDQGLMAAIEQVDRATSRYPSYYMINCAHPTHFEPVLAAGAPFLHRIRGLRANASRMSHAQLNDAAELDIGNPGELAEQYARIKRRLRNLNVMGGCCGTDQRHIEQIAVACGTRSRTS